jgi:genome maintenance exonuclease 1
MHKYFSGTPYDDIVIDSEEPMNGWKSVKGLLKNEIKLVEHECDVNHPHLFYTGRLDCLAYYKNRLSLIEWKFGEKRKTTLHDMYDYPIQLTAYLGAILSDPKFKTIHDSNPMFINTIVVRIYKDGSEPSIHEFSFNQILYYWEVWLRRLKMFWSNVIKIDKASHKD